MKLSKSCNTIYIFSRQTALCNLGAIKSVIFDQSEFDLRCEWGERGVA